MRNCCSAVLFAFSCLVGFLVTPAQQASDASALPAFLCWSIFMVVRRPPGCVPTHIPASDRNLRQMHTRGQHPSSHLENKDWSPWLNEQHKHNSMLRKRCPSSSLPSGARPADRCSAVGQENILCVFRSGTNMGAITHRTEKKRAVLYLPDTMQEK